jgi:hypothetical protein
MNMNIQLYTLLADQYQHEWYAVTDILNNHGAFIFSIKQSNALLGLLDLKINVFWSFKMLLSIYQSEWCKIPESLNCNCDTTFVVVQLK